MKLLALILSLPTENASTRQRTWRALKASGAAVLRDGVYLMPEQGNCCGILEDLATDVRDNGGSAYVLRVEEPAGTDFIQLFNRSDDFAALVVKLDQIRDGLNTDTAQEYLKQVRKLRKSFITLAEIDYFPGEAQRQTEYVLHELELACAQALSPDEPHAVNGVIKRLNLAEYQQRIWATRQRPWVDRLASAWLIRRFIDPQAQLLWLESPAHCPHDALGFDFNGATFSHIGGRVTFEVLATSFALEQPAITRLGLLVHYLDVGGIQPPEAAGVESVLAGFRSSITDDAQLLIAASAIFDSLITHFGYKP